MEPDKLPKPTEEVTQVPQDVPPTPDTAAPEKKSLFKSFKTPKVNLKLILISLVVLALASTAGYFYLQNQKLKSQISATPTPLGSPEPSAEAADPTADWKTYTNTKYGFSFKYPSELVRLEENLDNAFKEKYSKDDSKEGSLEFMFDVSRYTAENSTPYNSLILSIFPTNQTAEEYAKEHKVSGGGFPSETKVTVSKTGEFETVQWFGSYKNYSTQYLSIKKEGRLYNFGITGTGYDQDDKKILLDQILSTFEFSE